MTMNRLHRWVCRSKAWQRTSTTKLVPSVVDRLDLGDSSLEIGPGYGANLAALKQRATALTAVEIDDVLVERLRRRFGDLATIVHGDGAALPLPDDEFSSVVCFTMLHHVPSAERQDALFAEAFRVLRPGGVFAGMDSTDSALFRAVHAGDTCVTVDPSTLSERLTTVGFADTGVNATGHHVRFRAWKPAPRRHDRAPTDLEPTGT
jgi:ubiquinone/menaquinone biosynthesis C-methylase UbiE